MEMWPEEDYDDSRLAKCNSKLFHQVRSGRGCRASKGQTCEAKPSKELIMLNEIIIGIVGVSGILAVFLKYRKYLKVVKEIAEVIQVSAQALDDGKLSLAELEKIRKEIEDVLRIVIPGLLPKISPKRVV
jgi:hypothetical protein